MWITKKKHKLIVSQLEEKLECATEINKSLISDNLDLTNTLKEFPFKLGATVYSVELRNEKGRFTKVNASREHSSITSVIVDKKNYFKLADKLAANELFLFEDAASDYLDDACRH